MRLRVLAPRLDRLSTAVVPLEPKKADPHYVTAAHKKWREAVIARAGGRCQVPGCLAGGTLYADHIQELRDGGAALDVANGQALCARHHSLKTATARAQRMATRPAT